MPQPRRPHRHVRTRRAHDGRDETVKLGWMALLAGGLVFIFILSLFFFAHGLGQPARINATVDTPGRLL
jgi:hypothetical protein